jgi:hypothetical protein
MRKIKNKIVPDISIPAGYSSLYTYNKYKTTSSTRTPPNTVRLTERKDINYKINTLFDNIFSPIINIAIKDKLSKTYIFVLKLEYNKYYIGTTPDKDFNLKYYDASENKWTRLYQPTKIVEFYEQILNKEDTKVTLDYMEKYGILNVRGGEYSELILSNETIKKIEEQINISENMCHLCGSINHISNLCNKIETQVNLENKTIKCHYCDETFYTYKNKNMHEMIYCLYKT